MKLRLRSNTIRLRLLEGEVARLALGETIRETLPTPQPFHFAIAPAAVAELEADFCGDTLTIQVPSVWASGWLASVEVGRAATSKGVHILIEKDWTCAIPRDGEEGSGTFPNPTALG